MATLTKSSMFQKIHLPHNSGHCSLLDTYCATTEMIVLKPTIRMKCYKHNAHMLHAAAWLPAAPHPFSLRAASAASIVYLTYLQNKNNIFASWIKNDCVNNIHYHALTMNDDYSMVIITIIITTWLWVCVLLFTTTDILKTIYETNSHTSKHQSELASLSVPTCQSYTVPYCIIWK